MGRATASADFCHTDIIDSQCGKPFGNPRGRCSKTLVQACPAS